MIFIKDDQVVEITNENVISAFLASGWVEKKEEAPHEAPKPKKRTTKAE